MSNTTKLTADVLSSIFEELAKGEKSIKAILKDRDITYEALRKLLNKKPKIREEYDLAVQDGISLELDTAVFRIKETIEDLKVLCLEQDLPVHDCHHFQLSELFLHQERVKLYLLDYLQRPL